MARTDELVDSLGRALSRLVEAITFPVDNDPLRESLIQRFEYTFELSWKVMSSILADEGQPVQGVRTIIRHAARLGLINNPEEWFAFADARNDASHIYKEEVALRVAAVARGVFKDNVATLLTTAKSWGKHD